MIQQIWACIIGFCILGTGCIISHYLYQAKQEAKLLGLWIVIVFLAMFVTTVIWGG